jgi:uncharacterized protein YciI
LVLLFACEDRADSDDETLEAIQRAHLEFHSRLRADGTVVTNGPVVDQPDERLRGLSFYRVGSLEGARQLAETDPAVVAGRLRVDVMHWWCAPGTMIRPGRPFSMDD